MEMRSELLRVHRESGATSVYVTHDQVEAMTMATHVVVMKDGLVEQFGTPEDLLERPQTAFVATFVGTPAANVLEVKSEDGFYRFAGVRMAPAQPGHASAQLLYRAQDLQLHAERPRELLRLCVAATLIESAPMAGNYVCTLLIEGARISVVVAQPPPLRTGETAFVEFPASPGAIFDAHGQRVMTLDLRSAA